MLFKKFDDKRADKTEDLTTESIAEFVTVASTPLMTEFSQQVCLDKAAEHKVLYLRLCIYR